MKILHKQKKIRESGVVSPFSLQKGQDSLWTTDGGKKHRVSFFSLFLCFFLSLDAELRKSLRKKDGKEGLRFCYQIIPSLFTKEKQNKDYDLK